MWSEAGLIRRGNNLLKLYAKNNIKERIFFCRAELEIKATTIQSIQGVVPPLQKTLSRGKNTDETSLKIEEKFENKVENNEN